MNFLSSKKKKKKKKKTRPGWRAVSKLGRSTHSSYITQQTDRRAQQSETRSDNYCIKRFRQKT